MRTWNQPAGRGRASGFAPLRSSGSAAERPALRQHEASRTRPPPPPAAPPEPSLHEQLHEARQTGYQDGYRDGMAALDAFKQSFAQQMSAQIRRHREQLRRRVPRTRRRHGPERGAHRRRAGAPGGAQRTGHRPELIARVAHDAVEAPAGLGPPGARARPPDDLALVQRGLGEFAARQALLLPDPEIACGGVKVDADIASVDASIATRWQQAVAALGQSDLWEDRRGEAE